MGRQDAHGAVGVCQVHLCHEAKRLHQRAGVVRLHHLEFLICRVVIDGTAVRHREVCDDADLVAHWRALVLAVDGCDPARLGVRREQPPCLQLPGHGGVDCSGDFNVVAGVVCEVEGRNQGDVRAPRNKAYAIVQICDEQFALNCVGALRRKRWRREGIFCISIQYEAQRA